MCGADGEKRRDRQREREICKENERNQSVESQGCPVLIVKIKQPEIFSIINPHRINVDMLSRNMPVGRNTKRLLVGWFLTQNDTKYINTASSISISGNNLKLNKSHFVCVYYLRHMKFVQLDYFHTILCAGVKPKHVNILMM